MPQKAYQIHNMGGNERMIFAKSKAEAKQIAQTVKRWGHKKINAGHDIELGWVVSYEV